jgi:regulator of protease activity HflC (stomatin/prohibitin superfamily)
MPEIKAYVRERITAFGVEITELGIKDVILPGEVRELLNKVVEAERVAKANLIRRPGGDGGRPARSSTRRA